MKKRILALMLGGALAMGAVGMAACGGGGNKKNGLVVWGASEHQNMLKEMIAQFKAENEDVTIDITTAICSEGEAYANFSKAPEDAADVYGFANDQLVNLRRAGGLSKLGTAMVDKIKAENDAGSVEAGKIDDGYYGYPYAADNGYFMFYDSSIISEEQAGTLEGVLQACADNGRYFVYSMTDSWYVGSFFFGGVGGSYQINWSGTTIDSIETNFGDKMPGSDYTYAEIAAMGLIDLNKNSRFIAGDNNKTIADYATGNGSVTKLGACITGTWNAEIIQKAFGEGYAATKLPTFHSSLDGKDYQMGSLSGYKLYGVSTYTKYPEIAHRLAYFLASQSMQEKRYKDVGVGPSNLEAGKLPEIANNVALQGLYAQRPYARVQESLPSSYWNAMLALGQDCYGRDAKLKTLTDLRDTSKGLPAFIATLTEQ